MPDEPPITTYTEYKQLWDPVEAAYYAAEAPIESKFQECRRQADDELYRVLQSLTATEAEKEAARAAHKDAVDACQRTRSAGLTAVWNRFGPLMEEIGRRARKGLARLPRLIITWDELLPRATRLTKVYWSNNSPAPDVAPILVVTSLDELGRMLTKDRFMNELLLMVSVDHQALDLGGTRKSLSQFVAEWGSSIRTHVDDEIYLRGELVGDPPGDTDSLRRVLGAGVLQMNWAFSAPRATFWLDTADISRGGKRLISGVPLRGSIAGLVPIPSLFPNPVRIVVHGHLKSRGRGTHVRVAYDPAQVPELIGGVEEVVPIKADGTFSVGASLVFDKNMPCPRSISGTVALLASRSGAATSSDGFTLEIVDLPGFLKLVRVAELLSANDLVFLASLRKVYEPASLFDTIIGRRGTALAGSRSSRDLVKQYTHLYFEGETISIGHVITGIEGSPTQRPQPRVPMPKGRVDVFVTWAGDLGSVVQEWAWSKYYKQELTPPLSQFLKELASRSDLIGDIDGINMGYNYDVSRSFADNLSAYYGSTSRRRFTEFLRNTVGADGLTPALILKAGGAAPKLTDESKTFLAEMISAFVIAALIQIQLLDPTSRETIREKFGDISFVPDEVRELVKPDSPEIRTATQFFTSFLEKGLASEQGPQPRWDRCD